MKSSQYGSPILLVLHLALAMALLYLRVTCAYKLVVFLHGSCYCVLLCWSLSAKWLVEKAGVLNYYVLNRLADESISEMAYRPNLLSGMLNSYLISLFPIDSNCIKNIVAKEPDIHDDPYLHCRWPRSGVPPTRTGDMLHPYTHV